MRRVRWKLIWRLGPRWSVLPWIFVDMELLLMAWIAFAAEVLDE